MDTEYEQERIAKIDRIRALGVDPYGHRITDIDPITTLRLFVQNNPDKPLPSTVAGRIVLRRPSGGICFLKLRDEEGEIQVGIRRNEVAENVWELQKLLDLGDLIAVHGPVSPSNTGELTVWAHQIEYGAKAISPPPAKHEGLVNIETRYRQRYVDLFSDPNVMRTMRLRSAILQRIRAVMELSGYMEVETPMMQSIAAGASAKPFVTHHNALDIDLFLRIAPELYLKRLLVGGMTHVYEIGRNFRNEGISPRHNPEFTVLEAYQAYGNFETMMDLAQHVISQTASMTLGTTVLNFDGQRIDLGAAWPRVPMMELVRWRGGDTADPLKAHEFYERQIEHTLIEPTFVTHFPKQKVPLARESKEFPGFAECFELVINGQEIGPGYTEENNPILQEQRLLEQVGEDVQKLDADFIRALRYGMPPAGGIGIGVDRLCALLLQVPSIKDVILFPTLRPDHIER